MAAGELVLLLPDYSAPEIPLLGIYPNRKYLAPKVQTFLDFMAEADHACI